jgi:hypothetical protein
MRFFASAHIPRTPFRVGLITGPFGGPHHKPGPCPACGVHVHASSVLDWLIYFGIAIYVVGKLFHW